MKNTMVKMSKTILLSMSIAFSLSLDARAQDVRQHTGGKVTRAAAHAVPCPQTDLVEFEKMTWVEVECAIGAGKTTALIYTGGTEQRGPQNANGGHTFIAHAVAEAIARKLGNAIFLPVLPYTPNDAESIPGTIGITDELLAAMLERIAGQAALNGFRNIIIIDVYYVGGFGVMGWVSASDYDRSQPDPLADSMAGIIQKRGWLK